MKLRALYIILPAAALSVALSLALVASLGSPGDAPRRYLEENGWDPNDVVVLSGHYSVSWLWYSESSLRFTSRANPGRGVMLVEVKKSSPFSSWRLSRFDEGLR